jgi:hypothetical protein
MTTDLIVAPKEALVTPVIVADAALVQRANELTVLATNMKVDDEFAMVAADGCVNDSRALIAAVEAERVKVKKPFLEIGKQIDAAAVSMTAKLVDAVKVLQKNIKAFTDEQERIRQKAIAEAEALRRKAEAEAQAERDRLAIKARAEAAAAAAQNRPPPPPPVMPIARPVPTFVAPPPVLKSTSTTTQKRTVLVVDDLEKIPQMFGTAMLWTKELNEAQIVKLIKAGTAIPGCHTEEREITRSL